MKLEVGQFIRFKDKRGNTYIRNIKEVCNEQPHKSWGAIIIDKNANNVPYVSLKNIIKASYNIIDILEVGDYVNGQEVYYDEEFNALYVQNFDANGDFYATFITQKSFIDSIKTIVTKEQFEQMSYKIGAEDDTN